METLFPRMGNWGILGKDPHTNNVSGKKMLPRFVDVLLKLTGLSSVPGSSVTLTETFRL